MSDTTGTRRFQPAAVKAIGVVLRAASDVLAIPDPDVVAAEHYIRRHACEGIRVDDVLGQFRGRPTQFIASEVTVAYGV